MANQLGGFYHNQTSVTSLTYSYTINAGSNRILPVLTDDATTSVTCDGVNLTKVSGTITYRNKPMSLWCLFEASFPATPGAYDVVATSPSTVALYEMIGVELEDAQQDANFKTNVDYSSSAEQNSQTVSDNNSCYLVDFLSSVVNTTTFTAASSQTVILANQVVSTIVCSIGGLSVAAQGPIESNWTISSENEVHSFRIMIRDASEAAYVPPYTIVQYGPWADQSATASTTITATLSTPATANNLLVATVSVDKDSGGFNPVAGWVLAGQFYSSARASFAVYWRTAQGNASDNTFQCTWVTSEQSVAQIREVTGFADGPKLLGFASNGTQDIVTSLSTGTVAGIVAPAIAFANLALDSSTFFDEFPFLTNSFESEPYNASANYTIGHRGAFKNIRVDESVETEFSTNVLTGTWCSAGVFVFANNTLTPGGDGDKNTSAFLAGCVF